MSRLPAALLALTFAALAFGQGIQKVSQANQPSQQQAVPTLKATARLVYVDVVVHDKSGQPVHGLKAEDFTLWESGKTQTSQEFQEHTAPTAEQIARMPMPELAKLPLAPKLSPGIFTNFSTVTTHDGPLNILLLDRLNTALSDQDQMKQQINDYLLHAPAGQRMAIFGLTEHLMMLQGFTVDADAIHKGVNSAEGLQSTGLLSPPVEMLFGDPLGAGAGASSIQDDADISRGPTQAMDADADPTHRREKLAANQVELRALITLHAMDDLARYLATLPGRKNLIWFSGSFPVDIMPSMAEQGADSPMGLRGPPRPGMADDPFETVKSEQKGFEQTSALLSQAQVAVYPIDVKGLKNSSIFNADDNGCGGCSATSRYMIDRNTKQSISDFGDHNYGEHSTMNELADGTGGKAFLNTNDFSAAMGKALDDGGNYYTIAYAPTNSRWDGGFRQIEVKLRAKGYSLSYRKGYFAQEVKEPSGSKPMQIALLHGGPEPTQIIFSTRVLPVGTVPEAKAAPDNKLGGAAEAPFRRYRVEFAVAPEQVKFNQTPDGNRHVTLEFAVAVYDRDGKLMDSIDKSIQANIIPAAYTQFQQSGIPYREEISVPAKGEYTLRIAMRDVGADQVGAVEVPVSTVRNLPPAEVAVAAPASAPK